MPDYRSQSIDGLNQRENRGGRGELASDEAPPMSRLFIICNKSHTEEDFRDAFKKFGAIEAIWLVKDKHTQENKGIAYVKYAKTSDAAKAQEEMNGKCIGKTDRPLKVLVAANRNEGSNKSENDHERYVRLFIVIPNGESEEEIREDFSKWGNVERVTIVKDKETGNPKGFGYVRYSKFYHAALAFENCRPKYKAVFAEPKGSTKNQREQNGRGYEDNWNSLSRNRGSDMGGFVRMQNVTVPQRSSLEVIVSGSVNQDQLWRLFDIIPGLDYCQITKEYGPRTNEATVVYNSPEAAIYAKDKLHGLEYPMGERIIVKLSGMGSSPKNVERNLIDDGSKKECICSVPLPPAQQLAPSDAVVAQRLFIVVASSLPQSILRNVFSCWKGLIDVYLLANKNCGYVKYADRESAMKAIQTLNDAEICGTKIKVMEAEERGGGGDGDGDVSGRKRLRRN